MNIRGFSFTVIFFISIFFGSTLPAEDITITVPGEGVTELTMGGGKSNVGVVSGCIRGSGIKKAEWRKVSLFKEITIEGAFNVNVKVRDRLSLQVIGDDNILKEISTDVRGDTLIITTSKSLCAKTMLAVNVSAKDIEKVSSDGANDIFITGINNKEFSLNLDGASDVRVSGMTGKCLVTMSGTGTLYAKDLRADSVKIEIEGSGDATVYASKRLQASIDGAGDIRYYGDPKEVSKEINGVGGIEAK